MFGYILVNKPELKFKEFDSYQAYYCGLCKALKETCGRKGQMCVNYDITFLEMLLTSLYEPKSEVFLSRCVLHPFEKRPRVKNDIVNYCADMTLYLRYLKCEDDWKDERKILSLLHGSSLRKQIRRIQAKYPDKCSSIMRWMNELSKCEEAEERDIDKTAGLFGRVFAEIFLWKEDEWSEELMGMGFYLGKFIYLMDAYEDLDSDQKKKLYNPWNSKKEKTNFEEYVHETLTMMMAECSKRFEELPIIENANILRNILYSGVWGRYHLVRDKKMKKQKGTVDGSV